MRIEDANQSVTCPFISLATENNATAETLFPMVYDELHRIASIFMRQERANHTLQPTALIHEAYLRLVHSEPSQSRFENVEHFIATVAKVMRRILINHAKANRTARRGQGKPSLPIDELTTVFEERSIDLLALDEALIKLAAMDPVQAHLVELRFFGGMTVEQCAVILHMSQRAVYYDWALARVWLRSQIEGE